MNTDDKAIALCRVSTVKQSIEGTSLEAQEQRVYEAASFFGAEIVKFWSISASSRKGKNYQRKDLVEMLAYAKADKKVYTPKVSDFYRLMNKQKGPEGPSKSNMVGDRGVEPLTSTTSMWRSSQLS